MEKTVTIAGFGDSIPEPGPVHAGRQLGPAETDKEIRRVYTACLLYGISEMLFANSFMLLYLAKLGVPSERILLYLAIPIFVSLFALVPFAQWTDRLGKVFYGGAGALAGNLGPGHPGCRRFSPNAV